jgi:hypothetical protein
MSTGLTQLIRSLALMTLIKNLGHHNAVRGARLKAITRSTPTPAMEIYGKYGTRNDIKILNLTFEEWFAKDQPIVSFVLGTLAREILSQVAVKKTMTTPLVCN